MIAPFCDVPSNRKNINKLNLEHPLCFSGRFRCVAVRPGDRAFWQLAFDFAASKNISKRKLKRILGLSGRFRCVAVRWREFTFS